MLMSDGWPSFMLTLSANERSTPAPQTESDVDNVDQEKRRIAESCFGSFGIVVITLTNRAPISSSQTLCTAAPSLSIRSLSISFCLTAVIILNNSFHCRIRIRIYLFHANVCGRFRINKGKTECRIGVNKLFRVHRKQNNNKNIKDCFSLLCHTRVWTCGVCAAHRYTFA